MTFALSNYIAAGSAAEALRRDVENGLRDSPKSLPPKWFYDSVGSDLFDQITRLPEYYPTRAEAQILRVQATTIAAASRADTLVELGSGTSEKTRMLLSAMRTAGRLNRFVPFDFDPSVLEAAGAALHNSWPDLEIIAVCGDFEQHLTKIPGGGRRLFVFLGSTIGNLTPGPRAQFLAAVAEVMDTGDSLLLGTDLVKDADRLLRAYDDSAGITARFNRNVLTVINRELAADFEIAAYHHVARWNLEEARIEMWLRAESAQRVNVSALGMVAEFAAGEEMLTEVSCKFRREGVVRELAEAGLWQTHWWTDPMGDFGLSLAVK
jgi:L-histidine N-alpha-methyltransferase